MIPLKCIKNIQVIPQTIYCSRDEVIAILKYGDIICLDPKAKWVEALIKKIIYRLTEDHNDTIHPTVMNAERRFLTDDHQGMGHPTEMKSLHLFKFEYSLEENPFV